MEAKDKRKRKRVTLSIEQKIEILEKLDRGISNTAIASEYSIGKSTVTDIQKSRSKITQFAAEAKDSSSFKKRCIVRRADDDQFDKLQTYERFTIMNAQFPEVFVSLRSYCMWKHVYNSIQCHLNML